jgi:hypothetical protein
MFIDSNEVYTRGCSRYPDHVIHYQLRPGFPVKCATCSPPPTRPQVVGWFRSDGSFQDARTTARRIKHWNNRGEVKKIERSLGADLSDFELIRIELNPTEEWPANCREWL